MEKKAYILGTGESLLKCPLSDGFDRFGVNDVFKYCPVDYLVCVNHPADFTPERLEVIDKSKPKKFFSQYFKSWSHRPDFELIKLGKPIDINAPYVSYSITSPFVAAALAYKLGYTDIIVYGVDLLTHRNFNTPNRRDRIKNDFETLKDQLSTKGVELSVGTKKSILSEVLPIKEL